MKNKTKKCIDGMHNIWNPSKIFNHLKNTIN
jgi:hypothetical protein